MIIANADIEPLVKFLMSFELIGRESRLRTRFVKFLMERKNLVDEEHRELIRQFAKFDGDGNPIVIETNGVKRYDVPDMVTFSREYALLQNEQFIIEENEERKELLLFIKELILNCQKTFKDREALEYDYWCEVVETLNYSE